MKSIDDYLYNSPPTTETILVLQENFFDRDIDTGECFPFTVAKVEGVGRVLRASTNLNPGDLIFKELPVVVGHVHNVVQP